MEKPRMDSVILGDMFLGSLFQQMPFTYWSMFHFSTMLCVCTFKSELEIIMTCIKAVLTTQSTLCYNSFSSSNSRHNT